MASHVAFLRGMNLGGRRITNEALRAQFEGLGFDEVATFRASGNVAFESGGERDEGALCERIEFGLEKGLGYAVPTFLRSCEEVREIAARAPFGAEALAASAGKLQVFLLGVAPSAAARRKALALATERDPLAIEGRELYWLPSGPTMESDLDVRELDALLGPATQRTMGTIEQIAAKHCA